MREQYQMRETIEERHRQTKLFRDLSGFHSPKFNLVINQVVVVALSYTLLQMQLLRENRGDDLALGWKLDLCLESSSSV